MVVVFGKPIMVCWVNLWVVLEIVEGSMTG